MKMVDCWVSLWGDYKLPLQKWNGKRGWRNFKRGGTWGKGIGALKRGAVNPLQTMLSSF